MYKCQYFKLRELLNPGTFKKYGQMAWKFFNPKVLRGADICRELFGPLYINGKFKGKIFRWSGLRLAISGFSQLSAHFRGCALDLKSKKYSGFQMRKMLVDYDYWKKMRKAPNRDTSLKRWLKLTSEFFDVINEVENGTPTWLHIANVNRKYFKWINP